MLIMLIVIYAECHMQALYAECHEGECRGANSNLRVSEG
jgi:hypothetical protein